MNCIVHTAPPLIDFNNINLFHNYYATICATLPIIGANGVQSIWPNIIVENKDNLKCNEVDDWFNKYLISGEFKGLLYSE